MEPLRCCPSSNVWSYTYTHTGNTKLTDSEVMSTGSREGEVIIGIGKNGRGEKGGVDQNVLYADMKLPKIKEY